MGKVLVINGADFSQVAVKRAEEYELVLSQGGIYIDNINTFGPDGPSAQNRVRSADNVFIPAGRSIFISGLKGLNGEQQALRVDYCYYSSDERTHEAAVGTCSNFVLEDYFPINTGDGNDDIVITNTYSQDYYFAFTFALQNKTDNITRNDYNPLKYYVL